MHDKLGRKSKGDVRNAPGWGQGTSDPNPRRAPAPGESGTETLGNGDCRGGPPFDGRRRNPPVIRPDAISRQL